MTAETTFSRPDLPKAWPFEEAAKVADRLRASGKGEALFETGYGPSGLPHIGTFGEVARTTWVRRAFERLMPGGPTPLIAFQIGRGSGRGRVEISVVAGSLKKKNNMFESCNNYTHK